MAHYRAIIISVALMVLLAACNTVQGLGEDIQKGGQVIEDVAK
jgi:predicted small secreted protein